MIATEYKSGSNLEKLLCRDEFAVTAELGPPKSADLDLIKKKVKQLAGWVDAVNITDNQTAIVRVSSIAAGKLILDMGLEPIIQMTCRDRNRLAVQSDILGAYLLGIRNILCLTGDHQCFGNHPTAKHVFDLDSVQLIQMVKNMRDKGVFACGEEIKNSKKAEVKEPRMFIGAAANPFADPFEFRVIRLAKKVNAGVDFIQTQCIYDMERFGRWMTQVCDRGLDKKCRILAGVTPLKSVGMARYMRDKVAGVAVPDYYIERLAGVKDSKAEGINICVEQIQQLRQIEGVAGVHIMAIEWEEKVPEIVQKAGLKKSRRTNNEQRTKNNEYGKD
jgi:methylenetetrahydrofolate reductase (NADPH)